MCATYMSSPAGCGAGRAPTEDKYEFNQMECQMFARYRSIVAVFICLGACGSDPGSSIRVGSDVAWISTQNLPESPKVVQAEYRPVGKVGTTNRSR